MHLASLEQQRELVRYMNSLNDWLRHDVEDRQTELRGVFDRIDQLRDDLSSLDLTRGTCRLHTTIFLHITYRFPNSPTPSLTASAWSRAGWFYNARWP